MRSLKAKILLFIGKIFSFLFYFVIHNIDTCFVQFYTGWIGRKFDKLGKDPLLEYPTELIGGKYIQIGDNFKSGKRLRINAFDKYKSSKFSPEIRFGNNININEDCHIACINKVIIGDNVLIASKVFISDHSHGDTNSTNMSTPPSLRHLISRGPVIIEDNVWIGEGVSILPGVRIGKGVIVGTNSVVTKDIPEYSIAVGIPAKVIKTVQINER